MNNCFDDLRCLLDHASDLAQVVSRNGTLHYTNPSWLQTLGYTAADVEKLSLWQVLHPEDLATKLFVPTFHPIKAVLVLRSGF